MTTISVDKPGYPPSRKPFRMSGKLSGYTSPPQLMYADDPKPPGKVGGIVGSMQRSAIALHWSPPTTGAAFQPLPAESSVWARTFSFRHPGLSPGHHTVCVTDGKTGGYVGFGISNSAHMRVKPFRLVLRHPHG